MPMSLFVPFPPIRTRPLARTGAALIAVVVLTVAACTASSDPAGDAAPGKNLASEDISTESPDPAVEVVEPNTFGVGMIVETRVDDSRPTKAHNGQPELAQRTLPVNVYYPADQRPADAVVPDAPAAEGPFPLVVFSHGVGAFGAAYQATLQVIASAGYVVVAPTYPLGSKNTPGGATIDDIDQQTGDVSFLIDEYTEASAGSSGPFSGLIDPDRLGAFGHSMGAITSIGAGFQDCCVDDRLDAVAEWSGLMLPLGGEGGAELADDATDRPVLIVHGDQDPVVPYATGQAFYDTVGGPKYFVTLPGEGHVTAFVVGLGTPVGSVTTLTTIGFFDRYLKDDADGIDRLETAVSSTPGIATLESVGGS
jgi:pimeloyl-ACP methyl ester carboxylesterase